MTYATNVRMPDELGEALAEYSEESGIPRNTIIKRALQEFLDGVPKARAVSKRVTKKVPVDSAEVIASAEKRRRAARGQ